MSGFAGIIRLEPTLEAVEADRAAIARMAEAIAFRGPDAQQQAVQDGAAFAFSLLTTGPGSQAGAQPVTLDRETFFLGEARIDGRTELIRKLQQPDAKLSPLATDEELVLHFVQRFGVEGLPELDGDFSFVLWRPGERRLFAFRDLSGARPLFFSHRAGAFCFSNTIQAVLAHPSVGRREYDFQFIGDFLLGSPHYDPERTVYRVVRRLPAGHLLDLSPRGQCVRRIVDLPIEGLLADSSKEGVIEEFRRLFGQAIADRLPEAETAILLSGGLDSTSIAAGIVSLRRRNSRSRELGLRALCIDYLPLFQDDEAEYAARFAEPRGIPLQVVHSGNSLPFERWTEEASYLPEPLGDPYSLLYLSYRRAVSDRARVVFSGDGGDEVLRLQAGPYLRFLWSSKGPMAAVAALVKWVLAHRGIPPLGFGLRSGLLRALGRKPPEDLYPPWLALEFERQYGLRERWRQICKPQAAAHPSNPQAYRALNSGLFASVQELCDPTWTRVPLETRNPFLDRRLCRFLLRLPVMPWAVNKQLIRTAAIGILPDEIRLRPKRPVLRDPLTLQVASGKWQPRLISNTSRLLSCVDEGKLRSVLQATRNGALYVHLRPVALALWLNAVENGQRID
jgi:asparagine synthase (glutamine-hydrolysing)